MLLDPREGWFLNTSHVHIPNDVIGLLQLDEGFCLPPDNKENVFIKYIKHFKSSFSRFKQQQSCVNKMRSQLVSFLKPIHNLDRHMSDTDKIIKNAVLNIKKFVKDHPNIIFTRADKGNTVVALDKNEYVQNMEISLSDTDTYTLQKENEGDEDGEGKEENRPASRGGGPGCWNCSSRIHRYSACPRPRRAFCYGCGREGVTLRDCVRCPEGWRRLGPYHPGRGHEPRGE